MTDEEKRDWLAILREQWLPREEWLEDYSIWLLTQLADVLEQQWFPKSGRPKKSVFAKAESNRERAWLARAVSEEMRKLRARGHPGAKKAAISTVAKRRGLGPEGLRRRLNGVDLDSPYYTGGGLSVGLGTQHPLSKIFRRGHQIKKIFDKVEGNARQEKFEAERKARRAAKA